MLIAGEVSKRCVISRFLKSTLWLLYACVNDLPPPPDADKESRDKYRRKYGQSNDIYPKV
jgi:hypothetical protein